MSLFSKLAVTAIALYGAFGCSPNVSVLPVAGPENSSHMHASTNATISTDIKRDISNVVNSTKNAVMPKNKQSKNGIPFDDERWPVDKTRWYNNATENFDFLHSSANSVDHYKSDGNKKFIRRIIYVPAVSDGLDLGERVNNTVLEDDDASWAVISTKKYVLAFQSDSLGNFNKKAYNLMNMEKSFAPHIVSGDFNGDGRSDIAMLGDELSLLIRDGEKNNFSFKYSKILDLKSIISKDSINNDLVSIIALKSDDSDYCDLICGIGSSLIHFKNMQNAQGTFECGGVLDIPIQSNSDGKGGYFLSVRYNANGDAFITATMLNGNKVVYFKGHDGLVKH